jgi:DNA/RNA endonuclease G (NUC1)
LTSDVYTAGSRTPFTETLSNLSAGTKYYYKAYVVEYNESTQSNEYRYGTEASFTTKKVATATVTTGQVTNVAPTTATFNGSFSGASGEIRNRGFYYKKSSASNWTQVELDYATGTSGSFSANVSSLSEGTAYQVKAYVLEFDENTNAYVERFGDVVTFTTTTSGGLVPTLLNDYGIPAVSGILSGTGTSGTNSDLGDHWTRYNTTNSKRQIAVHTFNHATYGETVNYVVMYDENRYAPLWTAHTMNTTYWPDNGASRTNDWVNDPAIGLMQNDGLNDNSQYSRGHFVASNYRKTTGDQNAQTFYYTNKAPQWQDGFNNGVWSSLENRVKAVTPSGTTMLYVVTGVLYEGTLTYKQAKSGTTNVSVPIPSHFYKCIMKCTFNGSTMTSAQGIAFVYTNVSHTGENWYKEGTNGFVTSIDAIEQRAGFDFFAKVPDNLEEAAESNKNHTWFTGQPSNSISGITDQNWGNF